MSESTTLPVQSAPAPPLKRCAIIGTAPSVQQTPWNDPTLEIWALNDCYALGVPRATMWFDLHPFHEMIFVDRNQKAVNAMDVPVGGYVRPKDHLQWLRQAPFPVFVQQAPADWPNAKTFPVDAVIAFWQRFWPYRIDRKSIVRPGKEYISSTPSLMLMWAVMQGYKEIHIYGIHLATEWEYVEQRPNFEFLIGVAAGLGVTVVLPQVAPICKGKWKYAYEPKADLPLQAIKRDMQAIKSEGLYVKEKLAKLKPWQRAERKDCEARIGRLEVLLLDAHQQHHKVKTRLTLSQ